MNHRSGPWATTCHVTTTLHHPSDAMSTPPPPSWDPRFLSGPFFYLYFGSTSPIYRLPHPLPTARHDRHPDTPNHEHATSQHVDASILMRRRVFFICINHFLDIHYHHPTTIVQRGSRRVNRVSGPRYVFLFIFSYLYIKFIYFRSKYLLAR